MKKMKKYTEYTKPTVKVVDFFVEIGFEGSGIVTENIDPGQNISGNPDDPNALVRWQ